MPAVLPKLGDNVKHMLVLIAVASAAKPGSSLLQFVACSHTQRALAASHGLSLCLKTKHCMQRLVPTLLPVLNLCHAGRQEAGHEEGPGQEGYQGETAGAEKKAKAATKLRKVIQTYDANSHKVDRDYIVEMLEANPSWVPKLASGRHENPDGHREG